MPTIPQRYRQCLSAANLPDNRPRQTTLDICRSRLVVGLCKFWWYKYTGGFSAKSRQIRLITLGISQ